MLKDTHSRRNGRLVIHSADASDAIFSSSPYTLVPPVIELPLHIKPFTDPAFYHHSTGKILMIQTHISWVFLAGDFAYKIKKPVSFDFLDFSTIDKRLLACMKEIELNRRLAGDIYLEVLPISTDNGSYKLGAGSTAADYCLKMARFDQQDIFERRVVDHRFNPEWMDSLADQIAHFHQSTIRSDAAATQLLIDHITANLQVADAHPQTGFDTEMARQLKESCHQLIERQRPLLFQRQQSGYIRDCHGDLHLNNIVLFNGRPTPFDCIEFNDAFRTIDTMNDVAFLLMDCDAKDSKEAGLRFLSRYLEQTGDYGGLMLLPLYLSYRAGVRGKVACLLADDPGLDTTSQYAQLSAARDYFNLSASYLQPSSPRLFGIGGLSGSGKSHLALLGMQKEHAIVIRSDATRKRIASDYPDLPLYGDAMHKLTYQTMFDAARKTLQAGFSAILDATFLHPGARAQAASIAEELNVPLKFYWLDIEPDTLRARVAARTEAKSDISDADLSVLNRQLANHERPNENFITYLYSSDHWPEA